MQKQTESSRLVLKNCIIRVMLQQLRTA